MECNVYDFDKTIYNGDATRNFYKYCVRRCPRIMLALPFAAAGTVLYILSIPGWITPCVRSQETAFNSIMILLPAYYLINLKQSRVYALLMQQALDNSKLIKLKATKQK